jgi:SAM-dependent methyltransferase
VADRLLDIVETYFAAVRDIHQIGTGTKERSYYPPVDALLNAIGAELKPKVTCLSDLGNAGAGHPDFGLYAANQVQKGEPRKGQMPERGVIEMKGVADDTWLTSGTGQVTKYFGSYRLVIVTNIRHFLMIGEAPDGSAVKLEAFSLAKDAKSFWEMVATPRKSAEKIGRAFSEYLKRALTQSVALREPKDVAWFLASYARDALARVEAAGELPALANVRTSLEEALGVTFEKEKGEHFFRSTLVQTLFYGVFSAWVLWARETPASKFDWKAAVWHLNVPFIRTLFQQIASLSHLQPLGLVELLDWTAATLNRVDRGAFFQRFNDADAVQYFYEPFLEAFDPELRKELGVWYTPDEVVTYMVARVDKALRDDLGLLDGLASEQVYILDPCCGTGAFIAAVLRKIDANLESKGFGDLRGQMVKKAALSRVFGFEIMPAPFVVAHLQVGLALKALGATLDSETERPGVYLTNALTGWEPQVKKPLPFPDLERERDAADSVKQTQPILVILGNPPYNGYAGMAVTEERGLSNAYRTTKKVRKPEGQGLNDLYVRFFRMAERRIADKTGRGIVCFISNYSWLDGLSFTGMRERYLEAFGVIRIDCLNGDKYKTGKTTPEGKPDPSIFSTPQNREGIQVGTAIATMIRKADHVAAQEVGFRHLWGAAKRVELAASGDAEPAALYAPVTPPLELGLPFAGATVSAGYFDWPKLPELLPISFPGVKTSRDEFLVSIDKETLEARLIAYFDQSVSHDEMRANFPTVMQQATGFDGPKTRSALQKLGQRKGQPVRYAYRPFDLRWLYWEPEEGLLDRARDEYWPHVRPGNRWITATEALRKDTAEPQYLVSSALGSLHLIERGSNQFPEFVAELNGEKTQPNISQSIVKFLADLGAPPSDLFEHVVAILNAPQYREENSDAFALDWPRIPLGAKLASLFDPEKQVQGISAGKLRPGLKSLGLPTKRGNKSIVLADLNLTASWGYFQTDKKTGNKKTMAGGGMTTTRDYTGAERLALAEEGAALGLGADQVVALLGGKTLDVHLNADAWWANVPEKVWGYSLGGYQVIKKWLSYREHAVLGRALKPDEAAYVSEMIRRIAAILLMGPALDANYAACKSAAVEWKDGRPVS